MELNLNWEKRSDLVYAPENRKTPRVLDENELIETDVDPKSKEVDPKTQELPKAPEWLKRQKKVPRRYTRGPGKRTQRTQEGINVYH